MFLISGRAACKRFIRGPARWTQPDEPPGGFVRGASAEGARPAQVPHAPERSGIVEPLEFTQNEV